MNIKKILAAFLCVLLILGFCACGEKTEAQTVKIGLLAIDDSLPFFMAEEMGLYEKHGVNVELYSFASAADKDAAFEVGELDGDMTDIIVAALIKKGGTDAKIVCTALGAKSSEGRFDILAAPDSDIHSLSDLAGVEVAVGNNTIVHYLSDTIQLRAGTPAELVRSTNIPSLSLRLEALLSSQVKAAVLPDPLASLAIMKGAICVYDDTSSEDNLSQSVVIFSSKALAEKSSEIQSCLDAYFEAMEYISANPDNDDVRKAIEEFSSVPEVLFENYKTPSYTPHSLPQEALIEDAMNWLTDKGLLDKPYSYSDMVFE